MDTSFIIKWTSQVKKGVLDFVIMLLLEKKDLYGYELIADLKDRTDFDVAEGTIYPLLNRLKEEGFIESYWKEMDKGLPRKYYRCTPKGKEAIIKMCSRWKELNQNIKKLMP
jgi:PadR family transcriptional regulator, regulatory protein PadR